MDGFRKILLEQLALYRGIWFDKFAGKIPEEQEAIDRMTHLLESESACFERSLITGHVTGAGLVVTPDYSRVLLTLHKKLGKWLQLGGHCDGNPRVHETALRESEEESGMSPLEIVDVAPLLGIEASGTPFFFDIDIHEIPKRKSEPAHFHYDFRYLVKASHPEKIAITEESDDLRWFSFPEAQKITQERSMHRQFEKLHFLQKGSRVRN